MRFRSVLFLLVLSSSAFAQDALNAAKKDVVSEATSGGSPVGVMAMVQMAVAVGLVIGGLKFFVPRILPKLSKKMNPGLGSVIKVQESATFAGGNLYIVEAKGKTLLLCQSQSGVSCLADLSEGEAKVESPAFFDLLDSASERQQKAVVSMEEPRTITTQQARAQLERLSQLKK